MRVLSSTVTLVVSLSLQIPSSIGFVPLRASDVAAAANKIHRRDTELCRALYSTSTKGTEASTSTTATNKKKKKRLGLITFDLDDTLYPIAPVLDEANAAFSTAMSNFGYVDIQPSDIVETGKAIRAQISPNDSANSSESSSSSSDPLKPKTVNHKEIRMAAIRKEMEQFILKTKLKQTAADWATEVESMSSPVLKSAEK